MKALVADDSPFMRTRASRILGENGFTVIEASGGNEAVQMSREEKPNIILLDISMPDFYGFPAQTNITDENPKARITTVSGLDQEPIAIEALRRGAMYFLDNPWE